MSKLSIKAFAEAMVILLICLVAACGHSGPRTVEYPVISASNTSTLDFTKVELTDSATIITVKATYVPHYWIRIASDSYLMADGKKYAMTGATGIEPDKEFWMPDSGEAEFVLTFEPLPFSTKSFDFIEGDGEGAFQLFGVDLTGKTPSEYPDGLPKEFKKKAVDGAVPEIAFETGKTTINFHMLPYNAKLDSECTLILNTIYGKQDTMPVKFDTEGNSTVSLDQYGIVTAYLISNNTAYATMTLYPGETVDCYVDTRISGLLSMGNREKSKQPTYHPSLHNGHYSNFDALRDVRRMNPYRMQVFSGEFGDYKMTGKEYLNYVKQQYAALNDSINKSDVPEMTKEYQHLALNNDVLIAIGNYRSVLKRNYANVKNDWQNPVPEDSIAAQLTDEDYKEVISWFDISDPKLLYAGEGLVETDWNEKGVKGDLSKSLILFGEKAQKSTGQKLTPEDMEELKTLSNPFFANAIEVMDKNTKQKYEELMAKAVVTPTPDVADDKVFDAIIAPHKGKVVMVDLWNTWCAPCRAALKANEPLKEGELKNDDIVWIYIADESSDAVKYLEMIPDIKGIHYKVNSTQKAAINKRFNVDGIPYYILVDREGKAEGRPDLRDHEKYVKEIQSKL